MADRSFYNDATFAGPGTTVLFLEATIGAAGAPTLVAAESPGIKTITRTSAGLYVVTFGIPSSTVDKYRKCRGIFYSTTSVGVSDAPCGQISADNSTSGNVHVLTSEGNTATDPASGERIKIVFFMSNSSGG